MKVKMNKTTMGSPNGILVIKYLADEEYELPDSLAKVFLTMQVASKVKEVVKETAKEKKMMSDYENKQVQTEDKKKEGKKFKGF